MFEGFSDAAKAAIYAAHEESHRLGASETGAGHLLLGILMTSPRTAGLLDGQGVTVEAVELALCGDREVAPAGRRTDRWSASALNALEMSLRERLALGDPAIEVEHLTLAVVNENCSESARILADLGASPEVIRIRVLAFVRRPRQPSPVWVGEGGPSSGPAAAAGCATPSEATLRGFAPDAQAHIVDVAYPEPDHAVVQVGFRQGQPFYFLNFYRHEDGWSLERRASS